MSQRLRDTVFQVERTIDRDRPDFLNRRMLLRTAFERTRDEAFQDGYREGMQDALDAQSAAEKANRATEGVPVGDEDG